MQHFLPASALLTLLALAGCTVEGCTDEEAPTPACYSGTIVGTACMNGVLIEVNSQYPIGKPLSPYTNLVAAVNMKQDVAELNIDGQVFTVGQVISFTYTVSPQAREAVCPQNTVPLPVPHLVLSNVGTTACPAPASR